MPDSPECYPTTPRDERETQKPENIPVGILQPLAAHAAELGGGRRHMIMPSFLVRGVQGFNTSRDWVCCARDYYFRKMPTSTAAWARSIVLRALVWPSAKSMKAC